MSDQKPLLSICIPTYNRSKFLRVMLQALLPQVAEFVEQVEVWVIDNASPDETPVVVEESRALGPFQYCRNETNIGPLQNILKGPCELARGEFVWILGDHNLMMPSALRHLVGVLSSEQELDLFYANFRCATYPSHWPTSAHSGYAGPFEYIGNTELHDTVVSRWMNLIKSDSGLCTQVYAHVVRTNIWKDYWYGRQIGEAYTSGETTYPHTWMIAATCFMKPAGCLQEPLITIFNGAQSWSNPETAGKVIVNGVPGLLEHFQSLGLPLPTLSTARMRESKIARTVFIQLIRKNPVLGLRLMSSYPAGMRWNSQAMYSVVAAVLHVYFPAIIRLRGSVKHYAITVCRYVFVNCRIARFLRSA